MLIIDTHSHLNFAAFNADRDKVVKKCLDNDVWIINVGSQKETSVLAVQMTNKYKEGVFAAVGFHPIHVRSKGFENKIDVQELSELKKQEFDYDFYKKLMQENDKIVAVGETGLDYYHLPKLEKEREELKIFQKEIFLKHLELAKEFNKPLIIHCRNAHNEVLEILNSKSLILNSEKKGVLHCFSGNLKQAEEYRRLGFKISFTGVITFARDYNRVILNTPIEDIMIETDCPYLTPEPHRGKRNEPVYVIEVARKIAEIKNMKLEEIIEKTTENAREFFGI